MKRLARADRHAVLRFAPLQGQTARTLLPPPLTTDLATAVLRGADGTLHLRSEAVLRPLTWLPRPWRLLGVLRLVPRPLRDAAYGWVAARRQRLSLGPLEWRGPLTAQEQARFLP